MKDSTHVSHINFETLQDPMPYFSNYLDGPVHGIFASDALETRNSPSWVNKVPEDPGNSGLEAMTTNHININTGGRIQIVRPHTMGCERAVLHMLIFMVALHRVPS